MKASFLVAIATLVGATIGAGILGIPYVVSQSGFWTGILAIVILGTATLLVNLYMGEVALRTNGNHQLSGYAGIYAGKIGRSLASAFLILGTYGALIAYTIGVGHSLTAIISGNYFMYGLLFFLLASAIVINGIKSIGKAELLITSLLIAVVILIPLLSSDVMETKNFSGFDLYRIMMPYGVVLFAFMGASSIPTIKEELNNNRKVLKKAIIIGTLIPLAVYLAFTAIVIGLVGGEFSRLAENQQIATVALSLFIRPEIGNLANVFAILTMSTSFLAGSYALSSTFQFDYKLKRPLALLMTLSIPLLLFVVNALFLDGTSFMKILGLVGSVTGGIMGILIVIMHFRAKKMGNRKPEYNMGFNPIIAAILAAIFLTGIINELLFSFF
ncbi:hypothetical protein HYU11_02745 [Candidatus Woesearchaeota archaeon]|nr:hypothetical protein [Candidatus Woesearchaeota archaeon]